MVTSELSRHLHSRHTFSVQVFLEILDNIRPNVERSRRNSIMNALNCHTDLPENSHLESTVAKLLTLEVSHLKTQISDQIVVNEGSCRSREVG